MGSHYNPSVRDIGFHGCGKKYGEEGVFPKKNFQRELKLNENKTGHKTFNISRVVRMTVTL